MIIDSRPVQTARQDLVNHRNAVQARINAVRMRQTSSLPGLNHLPETVSLMCALELIESDIRRHPGLERFQRPLTEDDLRSLASEGPILCFIINKAGSYLIAVTQDGITVQ